MHIFSVSTLGRQSIKLFHRKLLQPMYAISQHKPDIKSPLQLQREITIIELAPDPYFLSKVCVLLYENVCKV